jgi:hypothetical protein
MELAFVCHAGEVAAEQPANPRNRPKPTTSKDFIASLLLSSSWICGYGSNLGLIDNR